MTNITTAMNLPFHAALLDMAPFSFCENSSLTGFCDPETPSGMCVCWERTGNRQPHWLIGWWWIVCMTWVVISVFFTLIWELPQQRSHLVRALASHRALRDALSRAETMVTFYLCHISGLCAVFPTAGEGGETLLAEVKSHTGPCSEYLFNRTRVKRDADQVSSTESAEVVITSLTRCVTAFLACSDCRGIPVLHPSLWPQWSALER